MDAEGIDIANCQWTLAITKRLAGDASEGRPEMKSAIQHYKVSTHTKCFKSQLPHKFVNFFIILLIKRDKLTDSCGN